MKRVNHVLLIDDNEADNFYHQMVIEETHLAEHLSSVSNSRKALECWQQGCKTGNEAQYPVPDLIFLDINMPGLNGFDLLDKVREIPDPENRKQKMKIFMLTTSFNPDDFTRAREQYGDLISGFHNKHLTESVFNEIVNANF